VSSSPEIRYIYAAFSLLLQVHAAINDSYGDLCRCQRFAWKIHKKRCQEPKQGQAYFDWLNDSLARIDENYESRNWAGVIECEDAAQDMLQDQPDELREFVTLQFATAHPKERNWLKAIRWSVLSRV